MNINFTHEVFISHMELKQSTYEILFSFVKLCEIFVKVCRDGNFLSDEWPLLETSSQSVAAVTIKFKAGINGSMEKMIGTSNKK